MKQIYHVVTSADGVIVRVFGESQKTQAVQLAQQMSRPGATFYADTVTCSRKPLIGCRL